jgi:hypothetical protein
MTLNAKLYQNGRSSERYNVNLDGTLRDSSMVAFDTIIEDLSTTGFRIKPIATLNVGENITLGLSGLGLRKAHVVRAETRGCACEFLVPLGADDLQIALSGVQSELISFPTRIFDSTLSTDNPEPFVEPFPIIIKLVAYTSLIFASWGMLIGVIKFI